jgi:hypothetical protein
MNSAHAMNSAMSPSRAASNFAGRTSAFGNSALTGSRFGSTSRGSTAGSTSRFSHLTLGNSAAFGGASGRFGGNSAFRSGLGFGGGYGWRGRGWGCCGFGWGLGFGWGFGWGLGFGWGGPWWYSPWYNPYWYGAWGWPGYYDYDAYPPYQPSGPVTYPPPYGPGDDNSGANPDQSQSYAAPQSDIAPQMYSNPSGDTGSGIGSDVTPDLGPDTGNIAESAPTVLLYLKDGTTFPATDYWVANGKLHYRISYGGESSIEMNQLDLQRTVDENAKRGVRFTLKPQPVPSTPAPAQTSATTTSTTI